MEKAVKFKSIEKFVNENEQMTVSRIMGNSIVISLSNGNMVTINKGRGLFSFWLSVVDENNSPVYSKGFKKQKDIIDYLKRKYE